MNTKTNKTDRHGNSFQVVTLAGHEIVKTHDNIIDAQSHVSSRPGLVVKVLLADGTHVFI